eukprot:460861_1
MGVMGLVNGLLLGCCGSLVLVSLALLLTFLLFLDTNMSKGNIEFHILPEWNSSIDGDLNSTISFTRNYENFIWPKSLIQVKCHPNTTITIVTAEFDTHVRFDECEYLAKHKEHITTYTQHDKNGSVSSTYFIDIYPSHYYPSTNVATYWMTYRIITAIACLLTVWLLPIPVLLLLFAFCLLLLVVCCLDELNPIPGNCINTLKILTQKPKYLVVPCFIAIVLWSVALIMIFCPTNYDSTYEYSARQVLEIYFDNHSSDLIYDMNEKAYGQYRVIVAIFVSYFIWAITYWCIWNDENKLQAATTTNVKRKNHMHREQIQLVPFENANNNNTNNNNK